MIPWKGRLRPPGSVGDALAGLQLVRQLFIKQNIERNDSIKLIKDENAKAKSYIKKKIIINSNKDDDDDEYDYNNLILTNGKLTSRARGEFNSRFWNKEKLYKNKEQKDKNNVINFITREELFYEHI